MGRRLLTLCGPDTFIREALLPRRRAYPELADSWRKRLALALRLASPLLLTLVVLGATLKREFPDPYAWPALALMGVAVLFFARTRHRVVLLPTLALLAAQAGVTLVDALRSPTPLAVGLLLAAPLLLWGLLRIACSGELHDMPREPQDQRRGDFPPRQGLGFTPLD